MKGGGLCKDGQVRQDFLKGGHGNPVSCGRLERRDICEQLGWAKQKILKGGDVLTVFTILNSVCHLASGLCKFIGHWRVPCTGRRPLTKVWA